MMDKDLWVTWNSRNGDGVLLIGGVKGVICWEEIFDVVDDGDVERTAWAASDFLSEFEVFLGDLE